MKSVQDTYLLHNGVAIPCVGYGTCDTDGEVTVRSVKCALQAGYRLIDTAMFYKNEESVGKGIRESGVPREEITVVSKLWNYDHSYEKAKKSFQESLERLGLDYLDLYLMKTTAKPGKPLRSCITREKSRPSASATLSPTIWRKSWREPRSCPW